jgi:FKBP-type peptidyl-prolyl cis-trans isomerase
MDRLVSSGVTIYLEKLVSDYQHRSKVPHLPDERQKRQLHFLSDSSIVAFSIDSDELCCVQVSNNVCWTLDMIAMMVDDRNHDTNNQQRLQPQHHGYLYYHGTSPPSATNLHNKRGLKDVKSSVLLAHVTSHLPTLTGIGLKWFGGNANCNSAFTPTDDESSGKSCSYYFSIGGNVPSSISLSMVGNIAIFRRDHADVIFPAMNLSSNIATTLSECKPSDTIAAKEEKEIESQIPTTMLSKSVNGQTPTSLDDSCSASLTNIDIPPMTDPKECSQSVNTSKTTPGRKKRKKTGVTNEIIMDTKTSNYLQGKPLSERRLSSGVVLQDWCIGTGRTIQWGRIATLRVEELWQNGISVAFRNPSGGDDDSQTPLTSTWSFRYGTGQVIRGLDEGLEGMRTGGKRRIMIPPERAYGSEGNGAIIPPNATVTMLVTLISVGKK